MFPINALTLVSWQVNFASRQVDFQFRIYLPEWTNENFRKKTTIMNARIDLDLDLLIWESLDLDLLIHARSSRKSRNQALIPHMLT